jgi:hypothetical protein
MSDSAFFAIHNPPSIRMIVLTVSLILILLIADWANNDLLFVADFIVIVIVAILWFRYIRAHGFHPKYMPEGMTPKDDFN